MLYLMVQCWSFSGANKYCECDRGIECQEKACNAYVYEIQAIPITCCHFCHHAETFCYALGSVSHGAMLFPRWLCDSRDVAIQAWSVAAGYRGGRHPTEGNADPVPGPWQWCEPVANRPRSFTNTSGSNIICHYHFLVQFQPKSIFAWMRLPRVLKKQKQYSTYNCGIRHFLVLGMAIHFYFVDKIRPHFCTLSPIRKCYIAITALVSDQVCHYIGVFVTMEDDQDLCCPLSH